MDSAACCDVLIPVHNQPNWLALCVGEVFENTPAANLGHILLIDDASDGRTKTVLDELAGRHPEIRVLSQDGHKGFAAAVNRGLSASTAPYVLLLNTDCLLTAGAIPKLMHHCEMDASVGLVSPLSNNSPPLDLPILPGCSYHHMNALLASALPGERQDACTIVGNALLMTRRCVEATGEFDTAYGAGYGEETDYQFAAMARGFRAVAALDTYVFHYGGASFGDPERNRVLRERNRRRFFRRWRGEFDALAARVPPGGIRHSVEQALERAAVPPPLCDVLFVLSTIDQNTGGCHVVVDICNLAARRGMNVTLACTTGASGIAWQEPLFFAPVVFASEQEMILQRCLVPKVVIATAWRTVYPCTVFAEARRIPCQYFVQGYEAMFEQGALFPAVEESFHLADGIFTTSEWLREMIASHSADPVPVLPPGFDERLFHAEGRKSGGRVCVCAVLRGSSDKGQPLLLEVLHRLGEWRDRIDLIVLMRDAFALPSRWEGRCEVHHLPLRQDRIAGVLRRADIFLDASLQEGFGLMPLEALACGCAVVASDSGGNREYLRDGENGFVIREVNRPEAFVSRAMHLVDHPEILAAFEDAAPRSVDAFRGEIRYGAYADYLATLAAAPGTREARPSASVGVRALGMFSKFVAVPAIEHRVSTLEEKVSAIYDSRVWRTLCKAGKMLLFFAALAERLRRLFSFGRARKHPTGD